MKESSLELKIHDYIDTELSAKFTTKQSRSHIHVNLKSKTRATVYIDDGLNWGFHRYEIVIIGNTIYHHAYVN